MIELLTFQRLVQPFLDEDPALPLFVSVCCNRLYVGRTAPTACRTCPRIPTPHAVTPESDLPGILASIQP